MRAEGYRLDLREIRVIETSVVSARLSTDAEVTLGGEKKEGSRIVFSDVAPGRHILTVTPANGDSPIRTVIDAPARRVTQLGMVALPLPAPTLALAATDAQFTDLSADGQRLAVVGTDQQSLRVYSTVTRTPELLRSIVLPGGLSIAELSWVSNDSVVIICADRLLRVELPGAIYEMQIGTRPLQVVALPGTQTLLVLDQSRQLLSFLKDGTRPTVVAEGVTGVSLAATDKVYIARGNHIEQLTGAGALPLLLPGVSIVGIEQTGDRLVAWDAHGQSWFYEAGAWKDGPMDVREGQVLDERLLVRTSGALLDRDGSPQLSLSQRIDGVLPVGEGRIIIHAGRSLLDCSELLRRCTPLLTDVDQAWQAQETVVVRRGTDVSLLRWETGI